MKLLFSYLHRQRYWAALYILLVLVFVVVYFLYGLPLEAMTYALLLCAVALLLSGGVGFFFWYRRHRVLQSMCRENITSLKELPEPDDLLEEDYQALLKEMLRSKVLELDRRDLAQKELTDYYTLWVHQIKTPISAMRLLLQPEDTPVSRELEVQLFRVSQYVDMVLAYLRMGSESSDYVLKPCDLDAAVHQSVRRFAPLFIRSKIRLELETIDAQVLTDEKWLCFCLEQLFANVVQYAAKGSVRITFQGDTLSIADTGIGIAPEDLPRVCEKGYTGLNGRREKKATGIGLYLCKRILTKLGHRLTITSHLGEGTTASITFPRERDLWD